MFRPDRLITLGLVDPARLAIEAFTGNRRPAQFTAKIPSGGPESYRSSGRPFPKTLPVLMYHSISDNSEKGSTSYHKVCTSPIRFEEHMQCLKEWGYRGVSLREGLEWLHNADRDNLAVSEIHTARKIANVAPHYQGTLNQSLTVEPASHAKLPVVITFDDGFQDFHTHAFPSLLNRGFSATMYLSTAFIGCDVRRSFKGKLCLIWQEIREMAASGIEFGSHTVSHPELVGLDWPTIDREIIDSKRDIEDKLGHEIVSFAYPFAFPLGRKQFVAKLANRLERAGYENCATTVIGTVNHRTPRFVLPRLPCNQDDDYALLRAKLRGSYNWLGFFQSMWKLLPI